MSDRRVTPATDRVALNVLRNELVRPTYTDGTPARVSTSLVDLLVSPDGPRDRQLNFGADVTVIERLNDWCFVQVWRDGYVGWVPEHVLSTEMPEITHRVHSPGTHIYPVPDMKQHELRSLSVNARLSVVEISNQFARLIGGGWVPVQAICDDFATDPAGVAETLLGTPYLWGGNSRNGIDCSGLVQVALHACGINCPGDADLQEVAFAPVDDIQRGDLLFWPGHVAMACGDGRMVHATAWQMRVIYENIDSAICRINAADSGPFRGARRAGGVTLHL